MTEDKINRIMEEVRDHAPQPEAMMTEEPRQRAQVLQEWRKAREGVDAAREPKQRAVNERYRHWKCVPADAVYGPGGKRQP